jgi:dipeptidyl aminopeptidase/acylaminoacyl peptidase
VWLWDLTRQVQSRQTFYGNHAWAVWGPEPNGFTVDSDREGLLLLYRKALNSGPGLIEKLPVHAENPRVGSWSPDGTKLAFLARGEKNNTDIFVFSSDGRTEPFLNSHFDERYPEFSPDGRWLVYTSKESGDEEVYVRPYPSPARAVQISVRGGSSPAWSRNGREIFYRKTSESEKAQFAYYSVKVDVDGDRLRPGPPELLFEGYYLTSNPVRSYDVAPDGRFLMIKQPDESTLSAAIEELFPTRIQVVQNWLAELQEKTPQDE